MPSASRLSHRFDLPFVSRMHEGEPLPWAPVRDPHSPTQAMRNARAHVDALAHLAHVCEVEAHTAALAALTCREWQAEGWEEHGFADALVAAAVIGWRAQRCECELPFSRHFDAEAARHRVLAEKAEAMEAQLRALNVRPWRSLEEAGLT